MPTTSSDDFDSDSALEHIPNVPQQVPPAQEHVPAVPEHIPAPAPPDPPARRPRQPRPPPPPRAPSSRAIKSTDRGDSSRFQKAGPSNSVPFPSGTDAESNVDPGGAPAEEEADEQELANIVHGEEPRTHKQAMASPDAAEWLAAERYELDQLAHLNTYQLTRLPSNRSRTGCHWVYKIKRDVDGNIILYRARLVAQGFTQRPGEDFFETFAPVAKIESIRMLLAIAAILDWEIHVIDVHSSFLNSKMPEDQTVYLSQPPGYIAEGKEDFVWKLGKALYGLKQSGHLWYQKLKGILELIGFHPCKSDPCVFIWSSSAATSIISSHVDNLGLYCSSKVEVKLLKSQIHKHVSIIDLGEIQSILGIEVIWD